MHRLVLFDIDGTLLSSRTVFRNALKRALEESYGTSGPMTEMDFSGMTDPQIVFELMSRAGVARSVVEERMAGTLARFASYISSTLRPEDVQAKAGAIRLVERLSELEHVTLGLLTGNLETCARKKLEPLGLNPHFPFGAFGSDNADRYQLPALAVERAENRSGKKFRQKAVVIVGDSIHDVRCGQSLGVRAVGVATGRTPKQRLAEESADAVLDDFSDTEAALSAVLG